jgi:hypothetical protein
MPDELVAVEATELRVLPPRMGPLPAGLVLIALSMVRLARIAVVTDVDASSRSSGGS